MIIADTNEFHPLLDGAKYRDAKEADGSTHPIIIMRATYSTARIDRAYASSVRTARAAGLKIGHYGYMTAALSAADQGTFFAKTVVASGGLQSGDSVWCDDEEGTGNQAPRVEAWLSAAHNTLKDNLSDEGAYSGAAFWTAHLGTLPSGPHRWIASYGSANPKLPQEELWQFTDNRVIPGVSGPCDASIYAGTLANYLAMVGTWSSPPSHPSKPNCTALQAAVRCTPDNQWGSDTDKHAAALIDAAKLQFPYGTRFAQLVVGAVQDGVWGSKSGAALHQTVINVQNALTHMGFNAHGADGVWGANTNAAYLAARNACHI